MKDVFKRARPFVSGHPISPCVLLGQGLQDIGIGVSARDCLHKGRLVLNITSTASNRAMLVVERLLLPNGGGFLHHGPATLVG